MIKTEVSLLFPILRKRSLWFFFIRGALFDEFIFTSSDASLNKPEELSHQFQFFSTWNQAGKSYVVSKNR